MELTERFDSIFEGPRGTRLITAATIDAEVIPPPLATKEKLVSLLNEDLVLEYTAALQYYQHVAVMQGAMYDAIRGHLEEHAQEEITHASELAERINMMGGVPVALISTVLTSPDAETMMKQDLSSEGLAIRRYKQRIMQALSLGEFGLADLLQSILRDEEEHAHDLETSLAQSSGEEYPQPDKGTDRGVPPAPMHFPPVVPEPTSQLPDGFPKIQEEGAKVEYTPAFMDGAQFRQNREKRRTEIDEKLKSLIKDKE